MNLAANGNGFGRINIPCRHRSSEIPTTSMSLLSIDLRRHS
jgi:hypothetical protein